MVAFCLSVILKGKCIHNMYILSFIRIENENFDKRWSMTLLMRMRARRRYSFGLWSGTILLRLQWTRRQACRKNMSKIRHSGVLHKRPLSKQQVKCIAIFEKYTNLQQPAQLMYPTLFFCWNPARLLLALWNSGPNVFPDSSWHLNTSQPAVETASNLGATCKYRQMQDTEVIPLILTSWVILRNLL